MPNFKEFLEFLLSVGILSQEHITILQSKNPLPIEEKDILLTISTFLKKLESVDFFQITSSLYQKFLVGYENIFGYAKDLAFIKSVMGDTKSKQERKTQKNSNGKIKKSQSNRNTSHNFEKLYSDSIHKEESLKIKKENYMKETFKECTFVPEINQNKINTDKLNIPVFERLSKQNSKYHKDYSENQKISDELQECTFRPQVLKYISSNNLEKDSKAFQRLYQNAESIRQNQKIKKQNLEEIEDQELIFVPEINESSNKIITKKRVDNNQTPFDRLYQISIDKKSKPMNQEGFWKNEEIECTFKPEISFTEDYQKRSKILQETKNSNIYDRLYKKTSKSPPHENEEEKNSNKKKKKLKDTPIFNKLYNERHLKAKKQKDLQKEYMKEIGATFKPKIHHMRNSSTSDLTKSLCKENKKNDLDSNNNQINKSFSYINSNNNSSNKKEKIKNGSNESQPEKSSSKYFEKEVKTMSLNKQ